MTKKEQQSIPTVIDLFSGCGGFGLGAELAGFRTIAAIDIDRDLQSGYRLNFPGTKVVQADITKIDPNAWSQIIGNIKPTGIIGGPPCQGFSRIGKRQIADPRNDLIFHFIHQINLLKPAFFIMENVEGILDDYGRNILNAAISKLNPDYKILGPSIINAADFGAPTNRKRMILVGFIEKHFSQLTTDLLFETTHKSHLTIRDAISDLPEPAPDRKLKNIFAAQEIPSEFNISLSQYARDARAHPPMNLGWETAKNYLKSGIVTGFSQTKHTQPVIARFKKVKQGETDQISKYPRLNWEGVSPTLRAGTGTDKGSFQAVRPIHPERNRVITVREAARIQGFPDWFVFHSTKWHSFRMIGNSVSPKVSTTLLSRIRSRLIIPEI